MPKNKQNMLEMTKASSLIVTQLQHKATAFPAAHSLFSCYTQSTACNQRDYGILNRPVYGECW